MQVIGPMLGFMFVMLAYAFGLWILWKFYQALARIGEELGEIKTVLRLRVPSPERPDEP